MNYEIYVKKTDYESKIIKLEKKILEVEENIKSLIKEELYMKELQAIKQMKKNPKFFYTYVKKNQKTVSRIGPLQDENGKLTSEPEVKANLLQKQYTRVFSNPKKTLS